MEPTSSNQSVNQSDITDITENLDKLCLAKPFKGLIVKNLSTGNHSLEEVFILKALAINFFRAFGKLLNITDTPSVKSVFIAYSNSLVPKVEDHVKEIVDFYIKGFNPERIKKITELAARIGIVDPWFQKIEEQPLIPNHIETNSVHTQTPKSTSSDEDLPIEDLINLYLLDKKTID